MQIKFYKTSTEPTDSEDGAVWFDPESKEIKLKIDETWESYGGGSSQVAITQAQYDALTTKDPNTLYFIKDE